MVCAGMKNITIEKNDDTEMLLFIHDKDAAGDGISVYGWE